MKQLAIAASVVAALALSSVAIAGGTLAGKYTTTIKSPAEFKGTWVLNLAKGGTYTVDGTAVSTSAADTRQPDRRSPSATRPATAPAPSPAPTPGRRPAGRSSSPA